MTSHVACEFEVVVGAAWEETKTELGEDEGGDEDARVEPRMERDPPPSFTTPTNNYTYQHSKRDLGLWQAMTALVNEENGF